MTELRAWQRAAFAAFTQRGEPTDFLVTATPGAGKTLFALAFVNKFLTTRRIDQVIVVVPTDHLRRQWAAAAATQNVVLDPTLGNDVGLMSTDFHGYVTTYAQVASKPLLHRQRCERRRTLVVFDEIHHAGDGLRWGDGVREAFDPAWQRLCLTGTPFRTSGAEKIPFVTYTHVGEGLQSVADYTYSYRDGLTDQVVRPVMFAAYTGTSTWRNSAGDVVSAALSEPLSKEMEQRAWRTALDPKGAWVPHVIRATWDRLKQVRETIPDATALILASNQNDARAYAHLVEIVSGEEPALILSDDPDAATKLEGFAAGSHKIAVCVRMFSEGVDVPSAAILTWMTSYRTPLFFAQAVGRVVRARHRAEVATVFLPAVRPLLMLAAEMETARNHVLALPPSPDEGDMDGLNGLQDALDTARVVNEYETLSAEAEFAHILYEGKAVTAPVTFEEQEFLGIPGLLNPEQTAALLKQREQTTPTNDTGTAPVSTVEHIASLRHDINRLVSYYAARKQLPHANVHALLRRQIPGPPSKSAPITVLEQRRTYIRKLANRP